MSKKQIEENLQLSQKLAEYLAKNPRWMKKFPENSSFVVFSESDLKLNEINERLVASLEGKGRRVIKARQTKSSTKPWEFIPLFA